MAFLESETTTAVEAVLRIASPAPAETRPSERRNENTTGEAKTANMFAGLNVSPAPPTTTTQSACDPRRRHRCLRHRNLPLPACHPPPRPPPRLRRPRSLALGGGGGDGGLIHRGDVSPAPRPASPGTRTSRATRTHSATASAASAARVPHLHRASAAAAGRVGVLRRRKRSRRRRRPNPSRPPPGRLAAERDGTGWPPRLPRGRSGGRACASDTPGDEDAARGLGVEQPTIPAGDVKQTAVRRERLGCRTAKRSGSGDASATGCRRREVRLSSRSARTRNVAESGGGAEMESCRRDPVALPEQAGFLGEQVVVCCGDGCRGGTAAQADLERAAAAVARGDAHSPPAPRARSRAEVQKMRSAAKAAAAKAAAAEAEMRGRATAEPTPLSRGGGRSRPRRRMRPWCASRRRRGIQCRSIRSPVRRGAPRRRARRRGGGAESRRAAAREERRRRDAAATRIQVGAARARGARRV